MSEEIQNDGSMDSLKKTIIGAIGTLVTAAGVWASTHLFGGETEHKEEAKTETAAPAPIVVNIENTNQQKQSAAPTTIIKERVVEKPAKKEKAEDESPW
jgi:flagellar basal body-associated protein FliL